jgi:hypothetical protein
MAYEHKYAKGRGNAYDDFANLTTKGLIGGSGDHMTEDEHTHSSASKNRRWWKRENKRQKNKPKRTETDSEATLTANL